MNNLQGENKVAVISIYLFASDGRPYTETAQVRLIREGAVCAAKPADDSHVYEVALEPGIYALEASAGTLVAPPQQISVGREDQTVSVYLGEEGWPYYRMGKSAIPFLPREDLVAVAYPRRKPDTSLEDDSNVVERITQSLPLSPYRVSASERAGIEAPYEGLAEDDTVLREAQAGGNVLADGAILLFAFEDDTDAETRAQISGELSQMVGHEARVGVPIDLRAGEAKVIDNRFVVRFREDVQPQQAEEIIAGANGEILRRFVQAPNAYLVKFTQGTPLQSLGIVEEWHNAGLLVYGEPDIMAEIVDDVFPYDAPDDPTYSNQANLTLQRVDEAWRILNDIDPKLATGSPNIYVATLDRGIDTDHPDLVGNLTDGRPRVARCFDFSGMRECTVAGYAPDTDHGMGVFGIIGANTDNNEDIAGIASNTRHIGIERPSLTSVDYPDVLLWAAGFTTGNNDTDWPDEPLNPGAHIISCSHGQNGLALSGIMDDTLQTLATQGRGGLGTIVIYSAGNDSSLITGFRTWAAHPNTLAIANSAQPDANGVESKVNSSNFGPEIDVCAQGAGAPSLNSTGGEQTFGGTSASAPTVAGITALMLSVNPTMTWTQVRDVLRGTAVQIDPANTDPVGRWVNGFSQWYGFGRVDAAAAVNRAKPLDVVHDTDFDGDDIAEIPVTSPWGIGTLKLSATTLSAAAMSPNGSRFNGWLLNTNDNRFEVMGDLDGDGESELLVTSPWGIGVLNVSGSNYTATMLAPNGTRFDGWLLNTNDNRFRPAGDFDGDGKSEILVASPWGVGVFKLTGNTFSVPMLNPNGTRFDGWLLNTADNRFGPVGDFDGDGAVEIMVRSPWGVGIFKFTGGTFTVPMMARNGTRFGGWLLNTADNHFGPVGDFDGDGKDEILVSSPWGIGMFKLAGGTFNVLTMAPNGTRFGGWLLNTADNRLWSAADFDGNAKDELFISSPWGIGILYLKGGADAGCWICRILRTWGIRIPYLKGRTLDSLFMAPNGTRFDGWLLNTRDNHFKRFADITGDSKADILVASPWGIGIFSLSGGSLHARMMAQNGTRFGGWLLNTSDNRF